MVNVSLAKEHLNQAVYFLSATTVLAIFYTLVLVLYCLIFRLSYTQFWDHNGNIRRQTVCTLLLATVLMICATLDIIVSNRHVQLAFIDNATLPGGPLGLPAARSSEALLKLDGIANIVEDLLILGVLLWRVWVVWSGTRFVVPITSLSLLLYLVNAGLGISYRAVTWNVDNSSLSATPRAQVIIFILSSTFSMASLVFMTSTIIGRLVFIRRKHIKLMGKSDVAGQYLGIATMLIESYALDTLWNTGSLISFGLRYAPTTNLFINCTIQVDILTNFLVMYRVLSGRAWSKQTQNQLSTLNWDPRGTGMTTFETVDPQRSSFSEDVTPVGSFRKGV